MYTNLAVSLSKNTKWPLGIVICAHIVENDDNLSSLSEESMEFSLNIFRMFTEKS